jgi:hypothetical protein
VLLQIRGGFGRARRRCLGADAEPVSWIVRRFQEKSGTSLKKGRCPSDPYRPCARSNGRKNPATWHGMFLRPRYWPGIIGKDKRSNHSTLPELYSIRLPESFSWSMSNFIKHQTSSGNKGHTLLLVML